VTKTIAQDYVDTLDYTQSAPLREVGDLVIAALRKWRRMSETGRAKAEALLRNHEDSNLLVAHKNTQFLWENDECQ
jgi:hypothetical protein